MSMAYIRRAYRVPVRRGVRVQWRGRLGTITSASYVVRVRFDDDPARLYRIHPTCDGLIYLPDAPPAEPER